MALLIDLKGFLTTFNKITKSKSIYFCTLFCNSLKKMASSASPSTDCADGKGVYKIPDGLRDLLEEFSGEVSV